MLRNYATTVLRLLRRQRGYAVITVGGLALAMAVPVAYYASSLWLGSFVYRFALAWWIFAGSGAVVVLITLLTVAWRSVRAAVVNPVESLRDE